MAFNGTSVQRVAPVQSNFRQFFPQEQTPIFPIRCPVAPGTNQTFPVGVNSTCVTPASLNAVPYSLGQINYAELFREDPSATHGPARTCYGPPKGTVLQFYYGQGPVRGQWSRCG